MNYFTARSDLEFLKCFKGAIEELWEIEGRASRSIHVNRFASRYEQQMHVQYVATKIQGYQEVRERVARGVHRATDIATRLGVVVYGKDFPAPAVGGPIITVNFLEAVLHDTTRKGVNPLLITDALSQAIGLSEEEVKREFFHLINPVYWIWEALKFAIQIPFMLVKVSGFDVSKVEDHLIGRVFKILEIIAIIYVLLRLGFTKAEIRQFFEVLKPK